jgi:hypothetical protein
VCPGEFPSRIGATPWELAQLVSIQRQVAGELPTHGGKTSRSGGARWGCSRGRAWWCDDVMESGSGRVGPRAGRSVATPVARKEFPANVNDTLPIAGAHWCSSDKETGGLPDQTPPRPNSSHPRATAHRAIPGCPAPLALPSLPVCSLSRRHHRRCPLAKPMGSGSGSGLPRPP